jgi:hypothetical protein
MKIAQTTPLIVVNVDGVLTNSNTYFLQQIKKLGNGHADVLNPVALTLLEQLCAGINGQVIMATAWSKMFYPTAEAWTAMFAAKGVAIPVVDVLAHPEGDHDWIDVTRDYMTANNLSNYALLVDDPLQPGQSRVITVDSRVGLTVAEVHAAAEMLAPTSQFCRTAEKFCRKLS